MQNKAHLQKILDKLASRKKINQAIMAVESGDQSFRWSGVAGEITISNRPLDITTPFFIASIDKLYNATTVMLLSKQGKLDLDNPISDYLTADLIQGLNFLNGTDYSNKITIRHLLSHTSGLADWLEDYPKGEQSLIEKVLDKGDMKISIPEIAALVRNDLKPHFPPQDLSRRKVKARYSDTNYIILIAIIESICGKPLHKVHEELIYQPLSLHHTYFPGLSQPLSPIPSPVPLRANGKIIEIPELMKSFRGIYSTLSDTIAFLRKLTRQEVFQNKESFEYMQANWHRFSLPMDRAALRSPGWPIEYGLGLMRFQLPKVFTSMKSLPAVIGHTGSTGCWLFWCPEIDIYFSGSVDEASAGAVPYRIMPELLKTLYQTV